MAEPPSDEGGLHVKLTCALPAVADTARGALGTVAGVTRLDEADGKLLPIALVAVTVKVYAVPLVKPVTI